KISLSGGTTVVFRPNYDTPVISLKAASLGGLRVEPKDLLGLSETMARTWATGTKGKTEEEISHQTESIASSISTFAGRNSVGVQLETLTPFSETAADLWSEILSSPSFLEDPLQRERVIIKEMIKSRDDNPAQV